MTEISPVQEILQHPGISAGIRLWVKRDELLHPLISGNKWRKLAPLLNAGDKAGVLSFGGPFSNHLHALAAAGREFGFPTAAVVRGLSADLTNPTLAFARECSMQLHPVSKRAYDSGPAHPDIQLIIGQYPQYRLLPEGGATPEAVRSCAGIAEELRLQFAQYGKMPDFVCVPAGTGCTAAGLIAGLHGQAHTVIFPVVSAGFTEETLLRLGVPENTCFSIENRYDLGGFAKPDEKMIDFVRQFREREGILLDPVYTGKMMTGLYHMLEAGYFPAESRIVALHTGGLQGWDGFRQRYGISLNQHAG